MLPRIAIRPLMACSALIAFAGVVSAQTKVAVVNLQQAVFEAAEIKKADTEMQAKYLPRQTEIDKITADGTALNQRLQAGQGKLTPAQESDLQSQIQRLQRDLQRRQEDLQADVDRERNDILSKSSAKMSEIVKKLAEEKGFDLVVDSSTTLYFKPAMEITKEAIAAYDKAYPASAPAAAKPASK